MNKKLLTLMIALALMMAACGSGGGNPAQTVSDGGLINWDRKPTTIIFRAEVAGGDQDAFIIRNEIPPCTIYGDNHVVWTNELGIFNTQVLEDRLTDDKMREFVNYLALNEQIFSYTAKADLQVGSSASPVVETLTLFVNEVNHVTDAFAGWDTSYYQRILASCMTLSQAPVLVVPTAAWISAKVVPYDSNTANILWDSAANGLKLADLATSGERKWITDRNVGVIWNILRTSPPNTQFTEDGVPYRIALEVPSVTRESPPAP